MNKMILKTVSLALVILIILLVLDYFKIITFTKVIKDVLSLFTLILTVFSSTAVICTSKSGLNKFLNYVILASMTLGLVLYIIKGELNNILYVALLFTTIYALMDMLFKRPS
ncbi:hypothetical protein NNC19_13100 [Clostridium sp. SHJSY1]|uniref:hypothetical protein n=1 Tax=Clostridium sp. SHJSY1 TaxID=2942483 RepID=UPI002876EDF2|nr:hypothetical protein [Clostridium sp. SHJSY1]MDS0526622.1 hypothetical protein [Clostridium sp. SHJSY1]